MKKQYIGVNIDEITNTGMLKLSFNVSIFDPAKGIKQFNESSLSIKLKNSITDEVKKVEWSPANVSPNFLWI